jgi:hypothetical protein
MLRSHTRLYEERQKERNQISKGQGIKSEIESGRKRIRKDGGKGIEREPQSKGDTRTRIRRIRRVAKGKQSTKSEERKGMDTQKSPRGYIF